MRQDDHLRNPNNNREIIWLGSLKNTFSFGNRKVVISMNNISCIPPSPRVENQLFQTEIFGIGRNDKDLPICRTLSKHWSRGEGGGSQISDICSIIFLPSFHICFYIWYNFSLTIVWPFKFNLRQMDWCQHNYLLWWIYYTQTKLHWKEFLELYWVSSFHQI